MQTLFLQWKHGELSDREYIHKLSTVLRVDSAIAGSAGVAYKDRNLVQISDELHDAAAALLRFIRTKEARHA